MSAAAPVGSRPAPLLVYGGTFDPVHEGHVAIATGAADALGIRCGLLIPAGDPPHRSAPQAPGPLRAAMLRRAFARDARFCVDERELRRAAPSYTVDTLLELRAELGTEVPLVLLLGADAFLGLPTWSRWQRLAGLAHLAVFARPGIALDPSAPTWPAGIAPPVGDPARLREATAGHCVILPAPVSTASSTAIRAAFARGEAAPAGLPPAVSSLLREQGNPYARAGRP
jgi:nicotinate-nucleotide adenylyltransferase